MPRRGLDAAQVLDAAGALADSEGLGSVTFARLADVLGVRAPSLYNHVNGRAELERAITLRALRRLTDEIASAAAGVSDERALRAAAHAYRAYALAHPGCYEATLRAQPEDDEELTAAAQALFELISAVLRGWELTGEAEIDAIRAVRSALHGFVTLERAGGFAMARARDDSFESLIEMLAAGLGAHGAD